MRTAVVSFTTERPDAGRYVGTGRTGRGEGIVGAASEGDMPALMPAAHGWLWLKEAAVLFLGEPWRWSAMVVCCVGMLYIVMSMAPLIGALLAAFLGPVFAGGLMLGAQGQHRGAELKLSVLFQGFFQDCTPLLMVGLLNLFLNVCVVLALGAILFVSYLLGMKGGGAGGALSYLAYNILIIVGVGLPLSLLTAMAVWFVPSLVALEDRGVLESMKLSFRATRKNWPAFFVYGLILLGAGALVGAVFGALEFFLRSDNAAGILLLAQLLLVVVGIPALAVVSLSFYTSYRDIFQQGQAG
ncbi:MAG: hypothetical protein BWK76_08935 [Desulfobulbaceae bacterium A2]|nr:MAG: hypothetical protein BWK76_08935 [Desulfobulbaceae bacterium A2]